MQCRDTEVTHKHGKIGKISHRLRLTHGYALHGNIYFPVCHPTTPKPKKTKRVTLLTET